MYGKFGENAPNSKVYIITFPNGGEEIIKGLAEFCRNNKLNVCHMSSIATNKLKQHKGFKCRYATEQEMLDNTSEPAIILPSIN
jgi:hypothetical protein